MYTRTVPFVDAATESPHCRDRRRYVHWRTRHIRRCNLNLGITVKCLCDRPLVAGHEGRRPLWLDEDFVYSLPSMGIEGVGVVELCDKIEGSQGRRTATRDDSQVDYTTG